MNVLSLSDWINLLLLTLQTLQDSALHALAAFNLTRSSHGQPAWPFAWRLTGDVMLIDRGVARQLLTALAMAAAALALLPIAIFRRRARIGLLAAGTALCIFAPWPDAHLLLAAANPTSFHVSPTGFSATAIIHGQQLYSQHCAACHADDGKGNNPLALSLPVAPPNLASGLLWRRADGDLFWHLLNGARDTHGVQTMPGFAQRFSDADAWALIDFMKANAAGVSLKETGTWEQPVAMPSMTMHCAGQPAQDLTQWRGQRVRIITASAAEQQSAIIEDPRMHSLMLAADVLPKPVIRAGAAAVECVAQSAAAWKALAIITGVDNNQLAGMQLLVDRDGWLRARKQPAADGRGGWSDADMLCRAPARGNENATGPGMSADTDGLGKLIAAIDAEPIRMIKGGFVHSAQ